jgi:copper oxidase (laccase) domain-containing protein
MGAEEIRAVIGPAICGTCYEVSQEIFDEVTLAHPLAASRSAHGKPALDLPAGLCEVLSKEGVAVEREDQCTVESSNLFSYRRDGVTGRQAGLVWL